MYSFTLVGWTYVIHEWYELSTRDLHHSTALLKVASDQKTVKQETLYKVWATAIDFNT